MKPQGVLESHLTATAVNVGIQREVPRLATFTASLVELVGRFLQDPSRHQAARQICVAEGGLEPQPGAENRHEGGEERSEAEKGGEEGWRCGRSGD